MALNWITAAELTKHLPAQILSLGYPDNIDRVNLRGSSLNVVDLFQHKGWERIVDLSYPQDLGSYDIVLDCGTIEHCSNPAQAFINACVFTSKEIKFICDNTPQKIGRLSPGTDIPIVPESELLRLMPDYAIMFAWNYKDEILSKNQEYLDRGGHFIIPGKTLEVVGKGA
jgi:hypothetical protein